MKKLIYIAITLAAMHVLCTTATASKMNRKRQVLHVENELLLKRCECICSPGNFTSKLEKTECMLNCTENMQLQKLGTCPHQPPNDVEGICTDACHNYDYKCGGIQKCCKHKCGYSCQNPEALDPLFEKLPPMMENVTVYSPKNPDKKHLVEIASYFMMQDVDKPLFVIEARSHIGQIFAQHKLDDWAPIKFRVSYIHKVLHNDIKFKLYFSLKLRVGRWYQFRIAAVNAYGTRGFTNASKPFQLEDRPRKPHRPPNFRVDKPHLLRNGTIYTNASWDTPKSDLPIEKYRVTWALYFQTQSKQSLYLNEAFVRAPTRTLDIWNLEINSFYYFQVFAISVFPKKRFRSAYSEFFYNTTINPLDEKDALAFRQDSVESNESSTRSRQKFNMKGRDLYVKLIPSEWGLVVRIGWKRINKSNDKSTLEYCNKPPECLDKPDSNEYNAISVANNSVKLLNLKYNSSYLVRLNHRNQLPIIKTIHIPTCQQFRRNHPHSQVVCPAPHLK